MKDYKISTIKEYIDDLAAKLETPGGGSASALAGSLAAALASMVANFTIGKKKYTDVEDRIKQILKRTDLLKNEFLELMQEDIETFHKEMVAAYALPTSTEEQIQKRREAIENACKKCTKAPLEIAEKAEELLKLLAELEEKGNKMLISDIGTAAAILKGAFVSALMNVKINIKYVNDQAFKKEMYKKITSLEEVFIPACDDLIERIEKRLV